MGFILVGKLLSGRTLGFPYAKYQKVDKVYIAIMDSLHCYMMRIYFWLLVSISRRLEEVFSLPTPRFKHVFTRTNSISMIVFSITGRELSRTI